MAAFVIGMVGFGVVCMFGLAYSPVFAVSAALQTASGTAHWYDKAGLVLILVVTAFLLIKHFYRRWDGRHHGRISARARELLCPDVEFDR